MRNARFLVSVAMLGFFAALTPSLTAGEKSGLKVGDKATKFTLKDQHNKDRSLDELMKKGKVALVFHRSARW